jgi:D-lactate dehydrogenase
MFIRVRPGHKWGMDKWKIGFFEAENGRAGITQRLENYGDPSFYAEPLNKRLPEIPELDVVSVFIRSKVDAAVLDRLPNLKLLATRSTGYDHIDIEEAQRRGVAVANVPIYGENTVAEHTFALILSLTRNIHRAHIRTMRSDFSLEGLRGFDLKGKTLGVVGAGHIGLHVVKMAKGFGMKVLAFDVQRNPFLAEVMGFDYASFDELLAASDIVTLHAPYNPATHHLIDRGALEKMKRGALLINTSRGGLVDTEALVWALDAGILGGVGLDVLEGEELVSEEAEILASGESTETLATLLRSHILVRREDVVITPHIAFYSREAVQRIINTTVENIIAFIEGRPQNLVGQVPPEKRKAA